MEIKQQAIEAARPFADNVDDLLVKAAKIEAYLLGTTALTRIDPAGIIGDIVDEKTHEPVSIAAEPARPNPFDPESLPVKLDDDAAHVLSLAKSLTSDLKEMGYAEPDLDTYMRINGESISNAAMNERMKILSKQVETCDITDAPVLERPDIYSEFAMENYRIPVANDGRIIPPGVDVSAKLRPMQLQLGQYMADESMVINVCRQFGTTTLIAAFARQQRIHGEKLLILTNTHRNVAILNELIDDVSVNVYSFADIENRVWAGETYDYIVIDNAAFIPYAFEGKIADYVHKCNIKGSSYDPRPTKLILVSVPGQEAGWFYGAWTAPDTDDVRKMAIDWKLSAMTAKQADKLKKEIGEMIFSNQFENKFRPVEEPTGTTDLTK
jgi:hypothetical protein